MTKLSEYEVKKMETDAIMKTLKIFVEERALINQNIITLTREMKIRLTGTGLRVMELDISDPGIEADD